MSDFINQASRKEHEEFWRDFENGYETYKAGNDSRDCDVQFIQTYCRTLQVGYCEKFCDQNTLHCISWTDQAMICCSNCDRVCFDHDYESFLVSCTMSETADKTLLIASTVTLFSLPLVALLIYFCHQIIKKSPCYKTLTCRRPSFKCCDENSRIRVYLKRLRESKKQNASSTNCDDVYEKPYAFDDYETPYAFADKNENNSSNTQNDNGAAENESRRNKLETECSEWIKEAVNLIDLFSDLNSRLSSLKTPSDHGYFKKLNHREKINADTITTNTKAFYQLQGRFNKNKSMMNQTGMLSKEFSLIFHKI